MKFISNRFLLPCLILLGIASVEAQPAQEPGVAVQVYSIEEDGLTFVPNIAPNQTPNFDQVFPGVMFESDAPWADAVPGQRLVNIRTQLTIPEPGRYMIRVSGDGGLRLTVGAAIQRSDLPIDGPGVIETPLNWIKLNYIQLHIEQLTVNDEDSSLKLEWRVPGGEEFVPIPAKFWRSIADPTRVTSPGPKRLASTRTPGDGKPVAGLHPGYDLATIRPPASKPSVGAMAFMPDGRLLVGTFSPKQRSDVALPDIDSKEPDKLFEVRGATGDDVSAYELVPVADGLFEPSGLCAIGDALYVAHRRAVTRLTDEDGDGFFETHHDVGSGWEGWNYHQFTFGLVERGGKLYAALSTAMAPPKWEGMRANSAPNGPMRGGLLEIDPTNDSARVIAGGLRTPNTVALGPNEDLFYADNQGTWFPTSVLSHLEPGRFYGHFNNTNVVPNLAERYPDGGHPSAFADQLRSRPVVYLPQNELINSPSKPLLIEDGPFAGQMFLGEITSGGIRRVFVEKVNGQWQGAAFRFTQGLESGVNRLAWGPDGGLYIGGIGANGNWSWNNTRFGLQRLKANGNTVFEMHSVSATPDGFEVRFTKPVDPAWLADPENYAVLQWNYRPTQNYGGVKTNREGLAVAEALPGEDGRRVRLVIEGLKPERCVYLRLNPTSTDGDAIWSTEVFYTLNMIPRAEPFQAATLNGEPIVAQGDDAPGVGVGVLPPGDAVALIGRSFRGLIHQSPEPQSKMPRTGAVTQAELVATNPDQGVPVSLELGDLRSAVEFGDHRLHVEFLTTGPARGQTYNANTGNSGVYLQGLYEIQVLSTPRAKPAEEMEDWEAGSIYKSKAPDANASSGYGQWQSYDIWFRAARFDEQGHKTENARVTVYWNGQLIHDDVELESPTGLAAAIGENLRPGATVLTGPLRLQAHLNNAQRPVRYRNVWVAPLDQTATTPGPTIDLFDGESLDGWVVNGGRGEFAVRDGEIVGTAVPNSGGNTFLVTQQTYRDFELTYEIHTTSLNSGVQIRSHVDGGLGNRTGLIRGYQVEADPTDRRYSGGLFDQSRRGWLNPLIEKPYARRAWKKGEWNQITVVARGPLIQTWVNGVPAAHVLDAVTAEGHIGLQVHSVGDRADRPEVRFRNIQLRELIVDQVAD
ncbi:MAG: family 16 glycoside hydrolase [Planctomycetota bacterium]